MRRTPPKDRFPRTRGGRFVGAATDPDRTRGAQMTGPRLRLGAGTVRSRWVRLLSLLAGAVLALTAGLGSGAAFAYWTTTGTGFGAATTATPEPVMVMAASGMVEGTLYPGGTADLRVAVWNPNTFPVTITGIEQQVGPGLAVVDPEGVCERHRRDGRARRCCRGCPSTSGACRTPRSASPGRPQCRWRPTVVARVRPSRSR